MVLSIDFFFFLVMIIKCYGCLFLDEGVFILVLIIFFIVLCEMF